MYNYIDTFK